ncbi:MAG: eukaryotic-like serine/threonine-protein kinase [Frankiales bacterium]|jgi:serine/threonine-protein kinase|nr:eukaryotic-like serine/threonine-protein kinase [Frankiales bacterium]
MSVESGRMLGERYRLVELVAAGGMGDVWRADDTVLGRSVAVKILRREHAADPDFVERFRAEARHAAALSHPNIAAVHDFGETDENGGVLAYLVMELVPGEPLSALLARTGALPVDRTLELIAQVADALHAAHTLGVIHRDVKPGNILVRPDAEVTPTGSTFGGVALTDFGIAHATNDPGHLTKSGLVVGTAYYLSPEQAQGTTVTPASDLYALGVVAYECLSGARPFSGDNAVHVAVAHMRDEPPPLPPEIPGSVRDLVTQALAKDPAARPADAAAFAASARALCADPATFDGAVDGEQATTAFAPAAAVTDVTPSPAQESRGKRQRWRSDAYADQKRVRSLLLLVGLTVVVVGAALLSLLGGGDGPRKPVATTTPSKSASPAPRPATVQVTEAAYIGRPYATVRQELAALGLTVQRRNAVSKARGDTVLGVDPHGSIRADGTVTVTVAVPQPKKKKGEGGNHD